MNRVVMTLVCLLCLAIPALSQDSQAPPSPPGLPAPPAVPAEKQSTDYSQEPFVIEQYFTTARFESDGTNERDLVVRMRVQSDAGVKELGQLAFGYNSANEQIEVRYVRVHKADSSIVTADPSAVTEMTAPIARDAPVYTDYKEKHITVPALAPGETLEYEIVTRLVTPFAPGQFWYQHEFTTAAIVLDERLEINVPERQRINLVASPDYPYETKTHDGRTIYSWKRSNLSRPAEDTDSDKKKTSKPEEKKPDVQLTTFAGWEEVARWYAKLEQGRTDPTPEIRTKTAELIQGRTTDLEKIEALYDYVSKNIRYVSLSFGIGRFQPHSAGEIFANQYGDCKDKHTLLAAMLQAAGIPSDAVLISPTHKLDVAMPSPSQFNHMITAVPRGNELIWMDSTAEVAPFRLLASPLRKKQALLVPADGHGRVIETPADPPFLSTQHVDIDGQVSDLGKLTAHVHYTVRGDTELVLRLAFRRTPQPQWKQLGQTVLTLDGIQGEVTSVKPSEPTSTEKPFELDIDFNRANFLDWSSKKATATIPLQVISLPNAPDDETEPVKLGSPLDVSVHLKLRLPTAFTARPPIAVSVSRDYAEYKSSYAFSDHTLTADRSLDFKTRELPADRTSDYLAFARAVIADETQALAVENPAPGAPAIPSSAKADELFDAGLAALNSGNTRAAIPLLQRVVELDPQHKQAWNNLGLAYLRDGRYDEAAGAFQKQLGVNPFDEHANDYLGLAFERQQKVEEAAAAFRKQIEINPLDPLAHAALGTLFLEQHRYPEATPELEKAVALAPDNAELQVALGRAYLNTNKKEQALAAFDKGADLTQSPVIWNDIAYNLADAGIELDKAQQYAESAISATSANLRNMGLAHIDLNQTGVVASMGAYWDTLGWVYFRKGDTQKAERYIDAAWRLDEHGEVCDHLAQIYEKLGDKERAKQTYALALAAPHPVPETRARLTLLLGGNARIDALVDKARPELVRQRTFDLKGLLKEDASADFLLLLSPDGPEGQTSKIEAAKFVTGSESLRPLVGKLQELNFGTMFPDASPVKLVRRGTLACFARTGDCTFTLTVPEDVHSVN